MGFGEEVGGRERVWRGCVGVAERAGGDGAEAPRWRLCAWEGWKPRGEEARELTSLERLLLRKQPPGGKKPK